MSTRGSLASLRSPGGSERQVSSRHRSSRYTDSYLPSGAQRGGSDRSQRSGGSKEERSQASQQSGSGRSGGSKVSGGSARRSMLSKGSARPSQRSRSSRGEDPRSPPRSQITSPNSARSGTGSGGSQNPRSVRSGGSAGEAKSQRSQRSQRSHATASNGSRSNGSRGRAANATASNGKQLTVTASPSQSQRSSQRQSGQLVQSQNSAFEAANSRHSTRRSAPAGSQAGSKSQQLVPVSPQGSDRRSQKSGQQSNRQLVPSAGASQPTESRSGSRALVPAGSNRSNTASGPRFPELRQWLVDRDLRVSEQELEAVYQKLVAEGVQNTLELKELDEDDVRGICTELRLNRLATKRFMRSVQNLDPATIALPMPAATVPERNAITKLGERARTLDTLRSGIETTMAGIDVQVEAGEQKIRARFDQIIASLQKRKEREIQTLRRETRHYSQGLQAQVASVVLAIDACSVAKEKIEKFMRIADIQRLEDRKGMILAAVVEGLRADYDKSRYGQGKFGVEFDEKALKVLHKPSLCKVTVDKITFTPERGFGPQAGPATAVWDAKNGSSGLSIGESGNQVTTSTKTFGGFHTIRTQGFVTKGVHRYELRPWWESQANEGEMLLGVVTKGYRGWNKSEEPMGAWLGSDAHSWGWYTWSPWISHAQPSWDGAHRKYGRPVKNGDVIMMVIDMDNRSLSFELNGRKMGVAFDDLAGAVAPAVSLKGQLQCQTAQRSRCMIRRLRAI